MTDPIAELHWPPEWFGLSSWLFVDTLLELEHKKSGARMFVCGGVLKNGSCLLGLWWKGCQNIARLDAENGWMLEERIDPKAPDYARQTWAGVIEAFVRAKRETAEMRT